MLDKEQLEKELKVIKNSLDNLYNHLESKDFEELERKVINSFMVSNIKYINHLTEEIIKTEFGEVVLNNVKKEDKTKVGECFPFDLNGATLCGYCQNHFRSDGEQDTCNDCLKIRG